MDGLVEIRVYDKDMNRVGTIDNAYSLIWTRRYNDVGCFELHVPLTDRNIELLQQENLISYPKEKINTTKEAGVVEQVEYKDTSNKKEITVKGRFLECYLDRRLIRSTFNYSGTSENAMRQLINYVTPIPRLAVSGAMGYSETVSFQATMKSLLETIKKIAVSSGLGFRIYPDFEKKTMMFSVYRGENVGRLSEGKKVVFSKEYENLNSATYLYNSQLYRTVAVVGGEGEGSARKYVEVGSGTGLDLREIFIDAKDVKSDGLTAAQYEDALRQKGEEALKKYCLSNSFSAETLPNVNFKYREDYDLGDIVEIQKDEWGVRELLRITEIQEIYEYPRMRIVPVFGSPLPEAVKWED